jgi:small multidrug resistance pump
VLQCRHGPDQPNHDRLRQWAFLTTAILAEVAATLSMRASDGFARPAWIGATIGGSLVAFALLAEVLKLGMPVGVAYGIWAGAGVALTAVAGKLVWDDPLTVLMWLGILLTIGGVVLIELGSGSPH